MFYGVVSLYTNCSFNLFIKQTNLIYKRVEVGGLSVSSWWREIAKIRDGLEEVGFKRVYLGWWVMGLIHYFGMILG